MLSGTPPGSMRKPETATQALIVVEVADHGDLFIEAW
jgi:hypothetical protein